MAEKRKSGGSLEVNMSTTTIKGNSGNTTGLRLKQPIQAKTTNPFVKVVQPKQPKKIGRG